MSQRAVDAVLMRGGTSRGLVFHERSVPPPGPDRDEFFLEVMGSSDSLQVDGLGGGASSTSKVMVVAPSDVDGCEVEFLFGQVGVRNRVVDYRPNSGNFTSAVAAFVVDEGLVPPREPLTSFTMLNRNTGRLIRARVPVAGGRAVVPGHDGVPGRTRPGSLIENEYVDPAGAILGRGLLPTGSACDRMSSPIGDVDLSVVDAANLVAFVKPETFGLDGYELPDRVNGDEALLSRVERLRAHVAAELGLVDDARDALLGTSIVPVIVLVAGPRDHVTSPGTSVAAGDADLALRAFTMQRMHHAFPLTGLLCTAAAAAVPGTLVSDGRGAAGTGLLRIAHPKGIAEARSSPLDGTTEASPGPLSVTVARSARRLMAGKVFVREAWRG